MMTTLKMTRRMILLAGIATLTACGGGGGGGGSSPAPVPTTNDSIVAT